MTVRTQDLFVYSSYVIIIIGYVCILQIVNTCSVEKLRYLVGIKCLEAGCGSPIDVDYSSCLTMVGCCGNGHVLDWVLSDFHTNKNGSRIFNINLSLTSATILSGNSFAKISMLFKFMNIASIKKTSFHTYQRLFICPAINKFYVTQVL